MHRTIISLIYLILSQLVLAPSPEALDITFQSPSAFHQDTVHHETATPQTASHKPKTASRKPTIHKADLPHGIIGAAKALPVDDPYDNIFHIRLPEAPKAGDRVRLRYQLRGVQDHTALARGINDQTAVGSYLIRQSDQWSAQEEYIDANWLRAGDNVIRFRLPEAANIQAEIRDLHLEITPSEAPTQADIILDLPSFHYYGNHAYIKGVLAGPDRSKASLYIEDQQFSLEAGQFEGLFEKPDGVTGQWEIELSAVLPDGQRLSKTLVLEEGPAPDFRHAIQPRRRRSEQWFEAGSPGHFQTAGAGISLPENALCNDALLTITPLRSIDLPPLPPELVNVTTGGGGYRFLPDGIAFEEAAWLLLDFESERIPGGYSPEEIRTFFFDESERRWKALPVDTLLANEGRLLARTTHFTDFINGILKAPESPQTQGFTPTSMKELETADPASGIIPISPPSANSTGAAHLQFPLKLPAGRKGLHPSLTIEYSSEPGSSWLGLGWRLDLPYIGIETRWGVPRFDDGLETETYLFGGDQLFPVAHRGELKPRRGPEKVFHPRVEGAFQKIIRHGNNPAKYWWEVIDKTGTRKYFGGRPGQGVVQEAVLKDARGNIAHWPLLEIRDLDENFIRFHYTIVEDTGLPGGAVMGRQIYPDHITYTGHGDAEGKYSVHFTRDRQLGEALRTDIEIDARLGFKQVTADLLRKVEVRFKGEIVRSYDLEYREGAFYKSLLTAIAEIDREGEVFYRHEMEYYDEVRQAGVYQPYGETEALQIPNDRILGPIASPLPWANGETSVLGGSQSNSFSAGLAVTVGPLGNLVAKTNTVGGNYSYAESTSEGLISFVDISGDGLPDKVYAKGDRGLFFRKNLGADTENGSQFGTETPLNMNLFEQSKTVSNSVGAEAHPGLFFVGYTYTDAKTNTNVYFVDLNGDGLIDIANNGKGYFSFITENGAGTPAFSTRSADTPSPIIEGELSDVAPPPPTAEELDAMVDQFPLHDMVRLWQAPCAGIVNIDAPVRLLESTDPAAQTYLKNDGVTVAIQHQDAVLWRTDIAPDNFQPVAPPVNAVRNIVVNKGDQIYFRVQSVQDGAYDQVHWDPEITYTTIDSNYIDPNNKKVYRYRASEDFVLASRQMASMPVAGVVKLRGALQKPLTSDDLAVEVLKNGAVIWSDTFAWNETADIPMTLDDLAIGVLPDDELQCRINCATNIDWATIEWTPEIYYESTADGSPAGNLTFMPAVEFTMFNNLIEKAPVWTAQNDTAQVEIRPDSTFTIAPLTRPVEVTFSVKGINHLYGKTTFTFPGDVLTDLPPILIDTLEDDTLYFEYYIQDDLTNNLGFVDAQVNNARALIRQNGSNNVQAAGIFARSSEMDRIFGPLYRGWGHFAYNGNRGRADAPINRSELKLEEYEIDTTELQDIEDPGAIGDEFDVQNAKFIILIADPSSGIWMGYDNLTYLDGSVMSSSRLGEDDISGTTFVSAGTDCKFTPIKVSKSRTNSFTGGAYVSGGYTESTTESLTDFMDMNGDRYPDVVHPNRIIYTNRLGGLEESIPYSLGNHMAKSRAVGAGIAGNPGNSNTSNSGNAAGVGAGRSSVRAKARSGKLSYNSKEATESAASIAGFSGNINADNDQAEHSWMDMNGDGLPDKVYRDGQVALNMGYWFAAREPWGFSEIRAGQSMDIGAGLGINLFNGSFEAGVSSSLTLNLSTNGMQDVNGDGLVDLITTEGLLEQTLGRVNAEAIAGLFPAENARVRLNTGNGFGPAIEWAGISVLDEGSSTAESANVAITGCVPIFFVRICFNPSGSTGRAVSRQKNQLNDLDGDGYPDYLASDSDGQLSVRRSRIGRTNMLRGVKQALGASFSIGYELTGNTYELPYGKWVMSDLEIHDGLSGDGADRMRYQFEYEDGFFDRHERIFYGFKTIKSHQLDTENDDQVYRTIVQTYRNRHYYEKGLLQSELHLDEEENPYRESLYTFEMKDALSGEPLAPGAERSDSSSVFPALAETRELFYEGEATATPERRMEYSYDALGNVLTYTDYGDGSPADRLTARIRYHERPASYLHSIPASIQVESQAGILRHREAEIDNTGNITRIRQLLADGRAAQFDLEYDSFGNLIRLTRPENEQKERLFYTYTYDDEIHTYLTGITDGYGYTSAAAYDYAFGQLLESTDLNEQKMVYTIDQRGRVTSMTGPYELAAGKDYTIAYEYHPEADVPYALTKHYDPEHAAAIETYTFIDGLRRTVQVKKSGALFAGENQEDRRQTIVSGRVRFDAFGRITESFYPILEAAGRETQFNPNLDNIPPTVSTFDILDRDLTTTLPDGATIQMSYDFGADPSGYTAFKSTVTDPLGNVKESYLDARGRVRATADYGPAGAIWTRFTYNAISELTKVTDDHGHETVYTYDQLGRRTTQLHPDAGLTEFVFDPAGNLTRKITAKLRKETPGAAIEYSYDKERLTGIDYPVQYQNKVQFHYGEPGAKHHRAGRVWLIEDASGGREYFFGPLGEKVKTIRTILTSEGNVRTFVSQAEYDAWNRIQKMIYPDGEVVDYHYNPAGYLRAITSVKGANKYTIVEQLGYDAFDQRVFCKYGNGTITRYAYEPERRRLSHLKAQTASGRAFMDNRYTYDPLSNILSLENRAPATAGKPGGAVSHNYTYDQLYRLTEADGRWSGPLGDRSYALQMTYNSLHNILRKQQSQDESLLSGKDASYDLEYEYGGEHPHAPSEIGRRKNQYDDNGNLIGWYNEENGRSWQIIWDEENRMIGTSSDGYLSQYTYDAEGQRAVKSHGGREGLFVNGTPVGATAIHHEQNYTAYVSPYLVVQEHSFTKHYYVGDERVLSKIGTGEFNNDYWYFRGITAGNKNYVLRMQLLQKAYWSHIQQLGVPPGPPTVPHDAYPIPSPDSLGAYDNTIPIGWPRPIPPDPNGPPGPPTLQEYTTLTNDNVEAGYGFTGAGAPPEINQFYYHPDQVGSTSFVTDLSGEVRQHIAYTPFGEVFAEEHTYSDTQPYLFNAKELDEETGLYYYGARYYDPQTSLWLSTDPNGENYPGWSPYAYAAQNPVMITDPDGRDWQISSVVKNPKGRKTYNLRFTAAVVNTSGRQINMNDLQTAIKSQVERSFSGRTHKSKVKTIADIRIINDPGERRSDEHLFDVATIDANDESLPIEHRMKALLFGEANKIGGMDIFLNAENIDGMINGSNQVTIPHEVGHTAGLYHPDVEESGDGSDQINRRKRKERQLFRPGPKGRNAHNLMYSNAGYGQSVPLNLQKSTQVNRRQFRVIIRNIKRGKLNKK